SHRDQRQIRNYWPEKEGQRNREHGKRRVRFCAHAALVSATISTSRGLMTRSVCVLAVVGVCVLATYAPPTLKAATGAQAAVAQPVSAPAAVTRTPERALRDRYCVGCHNQRTKTAGLTLDLMDTARIGDNAASWEKVVRKLRGGQMPPANLPRPDEATRDTFVSWLETELDRTAAA